MLFSPVPTYGIPNSDVLGQELNWSAPISGGRCLLGRTYRGSRSMEHNLREPFSQGRRCKGYLFARHSSRAHGCKVHGWKAHRSMKRFCGARTSKTLRLCFSMTCRAHHLLRPRCCRSLPRSCRAHPSTERNYRAHRSTTRNCRAHRLTERSCKARPLSIHSCKARCSTGRSSKERPLSIHSCKVHLSLEPRCRAPRSSRFSPGEPTRETATEKAHSSQSPKTSQNIICLVAPLSHGGVTGHLARLSS